MQKINSKPKSKQNLSTENESLDIFIKVQIFAVTAYIVIFFISCFIALAVDLPKKFDFIFSLISFAIASFSVGFFAGMKIRRNGLLVGIIYSLPANTLVILVSLLMGDFIVGINIAITAAVLILCAGIGGILAVNKRLKR